VGTTEGVNNARALHVIANHHSDAKRKKKVNALAGRGPGRNPAGLLREKGKNTLAEGVGREKRSET